MAVSRTEGGLGLMSCVRESSPPDPEDPHHEPIKKRRFRPLRGLRRMFRRKERRGPQIVTVSADELSSPAPEVVERTAAPDDHRRGSGLHSGLSLSHDSVFSPEPRSAPESGSELETSSSLSVQRLPHIILGVQAELVDAVRRRRVREDTSDEEDLGLPRSPGSGSPTVADPLDSVLKESVHKSTHSTCSDGSLLSMASSEMDEDSYGHSSGHGSKLSLHDKKPEEKGEDLEVTSAPLSHSAARHRMAIKPRRTHALPRKHKSTQLEVTVLPVTPEVNEEATSLTAPVASAPAPTSRIETSEPDLPGPTPPGTQLKSASLPLGAAPAWAASPPKLSRSRSTAAPAKPPDPSVSEQDEPEPHHSFFGRLLSRRSGKKKKVVEEPPLDLPQKRMNEKGQYVHEVTKFGRHHPAARQRVEPINLSQERVSRMQVFYPPSPSPPDSPPTTHKGADDEDTLEGRSPLRRVIPLDVDPSIPKRTFVKKSQSFRRDEALPFVSLDTPSLPVGLGELPKDEVEDLNELTTLEVVDQHLSSERLNHERETTTVTVNRLVDSCQVTVTDKLESPIKKSLSLDSVQGCETEKSKKKAASSESINHQITIPVGASIVNISKKSNELQQNVPSNIKPEPRKSLKEVPNFYPVPAPRPSKRDSLEGKPPRVPEFLRVQLNHVDNKPSANVVLSTMSSMEEKISQGCDEQEKNATQENNRYPVIKNSKCDEIDAKLETEVNHNQTEEDIKKSEVCVAKDPVDPNQIKFLSSVKQWTASPYAISNPNYSFVSLSPIITDVKKHEKPIFESNQNLQKTVIIKDVKEKSPPLVDNGQEISPLIVLRQRSFVNDDKTSNIISLEKPYKIEEFKPIPQRKPSLKDTFITNIDRSRKLSLERLDSRNQENVSDLNRRKSREMSSSEENIVDRNSSSSSDTLASQDSGEVVLRRKSLSRDMIKQKDEEPELLKVFARRSLKLKDSDVPDDLEALNYPPTKSRDSDKENECGDSPPEERKKIKEQLVETKIIEKSVPSAGLGFKYQRSVSSSNEDTSTPIVLATSKKDNNAFEKRQRSRTIPDPKIVDPPSSIITHKVIANIYKEKEVEIISLERSEENNIEKEENVPKFKRIQQRKEEWEKRAQLAMKKTHP